MIFQLKTLKRFHGITGLLCLVLPFLARADVSDEVATATKHAQLASQAANLSAARGHLQHLLNCLLGPGKKGFDEKVGNPCQGLGEGAIADTHDVLKKEILQRSASRATESLKNDDLDGIKKEAARIEGALNQIKY
jgi:hypothetical protein